MKTLIALTAALISTATLADGFKCVAHSSDTKVSVYNQTNPELGTRNPAVMVLSDAGVAHGNKTIAILRAPKTLTTEAGMKYIGRVDLRFKESNRKGEYLFGTRLGFVKNITLDVDFNYNRPVAFSEEVSGTVTVLKRNGEEIKDFVTCSRYLKN